MTNYRRNRVPGASYFFTVALADRSCDLLTRHIDLLRAAVTQTKQQLPFTIDAVVILPEHLHCIWTLPPADSDYSTRWKKIKSAFSRAITTSPNEPISASRTAKGERGIWQRRFWEHTLRDDEDYAHHVDYIHFNPVKHGLVQRVSEWPHSSFHRHVRDGHYPSDWGGTSADLRYESGEI